MWHFLTNYTSAHRTTVRSDSHTQLSFRPVQNREGLYCVQNRQRHQPNLSRMLVAIALWQTRNNHVRVTYGLDLRKLKKIFLQCIWCECTVSSVHFCIII